MLTQERLRRMLGYDPDSGVFRWLVAQNRIKTGQVAGSFDKDGYRIITVDGRNYKAHRLAWFYMHGVWPANQIDHINRLKDDNRIANLRECTIVGNNRNKAKCRTSKSGVKGVSWHAKTGKYRACIQVAGKSYHLGSFSAVAEAARAYAEAVARMHGEFGATD